MIGKTGFAVLAMSLLAQVATAQMMGGGGGNHQGSQPSNPAGDPSSMMGSIGAMNTMSAMRSSLVVGTDGVVYTMRTSATATQTRTTEIVAIRPSGTIAWTTKIDGGMSQVVLSGNLLFVTSYSDMGRAGRSGAIDQTPRLIALSPTSGSMQWQLELDGFAAVVDPYAGGVYVTTMKRDGLNSGDGMVNGSMGTGSMKRSVAAVDYAGKILWKLNLD